MLLGQRNTTVVDISAAGVIVYDLLDGMVAFDVRDDEITSHKAENVGCAILIITN